MALYHRANEGLKLFIGVCRSAFEYVRKQQIQLIERIVGPIVLIIIHDSEEKLMIGLAVSYVIFAAERDNSWRG